MGKITGNEEKSVLVGKLFQLQVNEQSGSINTPSSQSDTSTLPNYLSVVELDSLDMKAEQRKDDQLVVLITALGGDENYSTSSPNPHSVGDDNNKEILINSNEKFNINLENYSLLNGILVRHWSPQIKKPHPSIEDYRILSFLVISVLRLLLLFMMNRLLVIWDCNALTTGFVVDFIG